MWRQASLRHDAINRCTPSSRMLPSVIGAPSISRRPYRPPRVPLTDPRENDGKYVPCRSYPPPTATLPAASRRMSPSLVSNSTSPVSQSTSKRCGGLVPISRSRGDGIGINSKNRHALVGNSITSSARESGIFDHRRAQRGCQARPARLVYNWTACFAIIALRKSQLP